jgi:pyruvate kinase
MLAFAVQAVVNGEMPTVGDYGHLAVRLTKQHGFAQSGQCIVVTAGIPFGETGTTNMLRIIDIGSD